eukprot:COSAG02_NODE_1602_length_11741_cov_35.408521_6_plen_44_part_00
MNTPTATQTLHLASPRVVSREGSLRAVRAGGGHVGTAPVRIPG